MSVSNVRAMAAHEARALLPAWLACAGAATLAMLTNGEARQLSLFAVVATTTGLGAQAIGHEYGHRTLDLMLTLPVSRRRLLLVKLAVLAAMVLPLAAWAWTTGLTVDEHAPLAWMLASGAICLAPALTMLCRGPLAGLIFSLTVPGTVFVAVLIGHRTWYASGEVLADWSRLMVLVLAAGAVLGWWLFGRLESIEGGAARLEGRWRIADRRQILPAHPIRQLVKKELRLQQMTFAITVLYLTGCAAAAVSGAPMIDGRVPIVGAVTLVYVLGLPGLIGSLATAEERQLGTLAWQLQLPAPRWQQWMVKAATVFGLTLALAIGVPVLLLPTVVPGVFHGSQSVQIAAMLAIGMTAVSLYVSSLCATAVRAVVASAVVITIALQLEFRLNLWGGDASFLALLPAVVLLVVFAFVNHRPEPPPPARVWRQAVSLTALLAASLAILEMTRF